MANERSTIKDIAREAGVSVSTVSRALNNAGRVDADTKKRIEEIVERMGYRPSMTAQSMRTQRTRNILLVVPDIANPFYANMAKSLQRLVRKKNYILPLFNTNEILAEELRAIDTAKDISAGGIVFASVSSHRCIIDALKTVGAPAVLLNSYSACEFDTVHGELNLGTYLSTKYLIDNGHRRIAFAGGSTDSMIGFSRRQGYVNALLEAGINLEEKLTFEMGFSEDAGYKAGKYFSSLVNKPTAICCANDIIAMGVLAALHESGISIPEQMSVTGMDDIVYSRISSPPLTTVTNDGAEFAQNGFNLLFDRIEGRYDGEPREVILGRELVVRDSVLKI